MNELRRLIGIGSAVLAVSALAVVLTTRAADQGRPAVTPVQAAAPTTKAPPPGAPQVPEPSATIRDDPTIAPDPKQSADNNVSFPSDI